MTVQLNAMIAAGSVTLTLLVTLALGNWWQHRQLEQARADASAAQTRLVLCTTDNATLRRALETQSAAVAELRSAAAARAKVAAAAAQRAQARVAELQAQVRAALVVPAGDCETEAEELTEWFGTLRL